MTPKQQTQRGFTIVELLTVVSIIVFMLAVMGVIFLKYSQTTRVRATQALLQKIGIALEQYHAQCGRVYPPDTGFGCSMTGANAGILYDPGSLWRYLGKSVVLQDGRQAGPFTTFSEAELRPYSDPQKGPSFFIVDAWGNPVGYAGDPQRVVHRRGEFDLFSAGPDGKTATNDGIDNDKDGSIDNFDANYANLPAMGEAAQNGALTGFKKNKLSGEVLDDINNWDPH